MLDMLSEGLAFWVKSFDLSDEMLDIRRPRSSVERAGLKTNDERRTTDHDHEPREQARPPTADHRPPTADRRPPTADRGWPIAVIAVKR